MSVFSSLRAKFPKTTWFARVLDNSCPMNRAAAGAYGIRPDCANLRFCGGGSRSGSSGGVQGVCHTPLHIYRLQSTGNIHRLYDYANPKSGCFPEHSENHMGHGKNYVLCRKNYIRHNLNYIRPFFAAFKHLKNKPTLSAEQFVEYFGRFQRGEVGQVD